MSFYLTIDEDKFKELHRGEILGTMTLLSKWSELIHQRDRRSHAGEAVDVVKLWKELLPSLAFL